MREKTIYELNQEWKSVATYYNKTLQLWMNNYFDNHPKIGQLLKEETNQPFDYIRNVNLFDLFESAADALEELIEHRNLHHLADKLPRPSKYVEQAEQLVTHVQSHDKEAFEEYKEQMFNEWQRKWLATLANVKRQLLQLNILDYGKKPLFVINAYISEFELLHRFFLIPFTKDIELKENSYRKRLTMLLECIFILEFDDEYKFSLMKELTRIFEPKLRNSLVKHDYMFDEESNTIHLFSPDALVRKFKPHGELEYIQLIRLIILMKSIFWILVRGVSKQSKYLKTIVEDITSSYSPFYEVIEHKILNPEIVPLLELFTSNFKVFSDRFVKNLEKKYEKEILRSQLLESFLIFRILIGIFLQPDFTPKRNMLTNFSPLHQLLVTHEVFKIQYLVIYEEMMQIIVHPFVEMLFGPTPKDFTLNKMRKVEGGKFSILFKELNKDFRDSLAHNSYYFDEQIGWIYTKYGKELKREDIKLTSSQVIFNYIDITNTVFPFLAEVPIELASAQLIKDLFNKSSTFTSEEWFEKERFALNRNMLVFGGMVRIRLALHYSEEDNYSQVSNSIRELFEGNELYISLTLQDLEILIAFLLSFVENIKARDVLKTLTKRLLKIVNITDEIYKRCLFILLFLATHRRDYIEVNKLTKSIQDWKSSQ